MKSEDSPSHRRFRFGLRQRIGFLILVVPGFTLGVGVPVLYQSQHHQAEADFQASLRSYARVLAMALTGPCRAGDLSSVSPQVDSVLEDHPSVLSVELFDPKSGEFLAAWGTTGSERAFPSGRGDSEAGVWLYEEGEPEDALHASGHIFAAVTELTSVSGAGPPPMLRVRGTSRSLNRRVLGLMVLLLLPAVLAGLGGLGLALRVDRRMRQALSGLIESTREIAAGNFERRTATATGDQLQDLGESINTMAGALATQRKTLSEHAEELETKVAERTLELEKARTLAVSQERIAASGILAAGIAHEVGNPLTAISTIVQGMQRRPEADATAKLTLLSENIERIRRIVSGLVDHSRQPASEVRLFSLNDLLRRTVALAGFDPRARNIRFEVALDSSLSRLRSVEGKLQQICLNILLNAFAAVPKSGGVVRIASRASRGRISISIEDNGPGIPEELRAKVLEPYFTTRSERGGTGLGLAVVTSLVSDLGGELEIGAASLGGARFEVSLPLDASRAAEGRRG